MFVAQTQYACLILYLAFKTEEGSKSASTPNRREPVLTNGEWEQEVGGGMERR